MTSEASVPATSPTSASAEQASTAVPKTIYVWVWLPGALEPVVAGSISQLGHRLGNDPVIGFVYARSYRARRDAISLFAPELPLREGTFDPTRPGEPSDTGESARWRGWPPAHNRSPQALAGCIRDSAPDAWGRRVINTRVAADPEVQLGEMTYLHRSGSNRVGALDFQSSAAHYGPRGEQANLDQLVAAADLIEQGKPIPADLEAAAGHGTSIGGARPKALLNDHGREMVAKFSSTTDNRPVVKAEAVGMLMASRLGIEVPPVKVVSSNGKDVLLVDRFDRTAGGARRIVVSGLTVLGLREEEARYATYADLALAIRHPGWADSAAQLRELFTRMVLNIAISNTDDHLRNHAAFWDGLSLRLTPAYDVAPQPRSTSVATHSIGLTADGQRASQFWVARAAAPDFLMTAADVDEVVDLVVTTIETNWNEVCDEATLTRAERQSLWKREILNDYAFYDRP